MPRKNMKKVMLTGMSLMLALVVTACGGSSDRDTDRLIVAQNSDAVTLDLHAGNDSNSALVNTQIFEPLVRQDEEGNIHPGLAVAYRQIDDRTWEFDLKQGVLFHNGEEFTASDVKFTLLRSLESPAVAPIVGEIDPNGIEIMDDYTIRISTIDPFTPLLRHLAHVAAAIMSEVAVTELEAEGLSVSQNPVGTGPFKFSSWSPGDRVELVRFEDYHGELPEFEYLEIRAVQENSNRTMMLETGEIDIAIAIQATDRDRVQGEEGLELLVEPNFTTTFIGLNTDVAPFDNQLVRQAMNYAIDSQAVLDHVLLGAGSVSPGPIGANVWGARTDLEVYNFNLERAKELMAEAGYADGFTTTLITSTAGTNVDIVTAVQAQLREINITANIEQMEWGAYIERLSQGDHEMFIMGWGSITGDADYGLWSLFHSSVTAAGGNRTFLVNDRIDYLLEAGRAETDEQARLAIYAELQELIVEEAPWLFLFTGEVAVGTQSDVAGFTVDPTGHHNFAGVYFTNAE